MSNDAWIVTGTISFFAAAYILIAYLNRHKDAAERAEWAAYRDRAERPYRLFRELRSDGGTWWFENEKGERRR